MATKTVKLSIKFPWWQRPYLWALIAMNWAGIMEPDPNKVAELLMRHTKVKAD